MRRKISRYCPLLVAWVIAAAGIGRSRPALADEPAAANAKKQSTDDAPDSLGEAVEIEKLKERYWTRGDEAEVGVVQNRLYSKKRKFELSAMGSNINGDPFLSMYTLGGEIGYHFSEYFGFHVVGWNAYVSPSSALQTLQGPPTNTTANTNSPKSFLGGDVRASLLYGKLSLLGKAILYFDAYLSAGAGNIWTDNGQSVAVFVGLGQQIHISQSIALNVAYRMMRYDEIIVDKVPTSATYGQVLDPARVDVSGIVTVGVSYFLDFFGSAKSAKSPENAAPAVP